MYLRYINAEVRVFIDGYRAGWNVTLNCFEVNLNDDLIPRTENTDPSNREVFDGIEFEVRTNGVPIKYLKYV